MSSVPKVWCSDFEIGCGPITEPWSTPYLSPCLSPPLTHLLCNRVSSPANTSFNWYSINNDFLSLFFLRFLLWYPGGSKIYLKWQLNRYVFFFFSYQKALHELMNHWLWRQGCRLITQLLSDVVTLSPRKTSGRDGDVRGKGGVTGMQMEQKADIHHTFFSNRAVDLDHKPILI